MKRDCPKTMKDEIKRILIERLSAERVEVLDESARHAGHRETLNSGGGHFHVLVVSKQFEGVPGLQRHRKIYEALKESMEKQIHALAITALTPMEYERQQKRSA